MRILLPSSPVRDPTVLPSAPAGADVWGYVDAKEREGKPWVGQLGVNLP